MQRIELINKLLARVTDGSFLEIGVHAGFTGANVLAARKVGVDPAPLPSANDHYTELHAVTSDAFFVELQENEMFDVVFIDGLHYSDQVLRDVENSLKHLAPDGVIVLHDCNPKAEEHQQVPQCAEYWNGDCWKAVVNLRMKRFDLNVFTIDIDEGLGIVRKIPARETVEEIELTYDVLASNRVHLLGLVSVDEAFRRLDLTL